MDIFIFIFGLYVIIRGKFNINESDILEGKRARLFGISLIIITLTFEVIRGIFFPDAFNSNNTVLKIFYYLMIIFSIYLLAMFFLKKKTDRSKSNINEHLWCSKNMWDEMYREKIELKIIEKSENNKRSLHYVEYALDVFFQNKKLKILDAGCGVSLIPNILQYWGHNVLAVDLSTIAIKFCRNRTPTIDDMAKCVIKFIPSKEGENIYYQHEGDLEILKQALESKKELGGNLNWKSGDLRNFDFGESKFDLILNLNGLRLATTDEIKEILNKLFCILGNQGLVVASNLNSINRDEEIIEIARSVGFKILPTPSIFNYKKENICLTEKSIVFFWPTG